MTKLEWVLLMTMVVEAVALMEILLSPLSPCSMIG